MASEYHGLVTFNGLPVPGAVLTATQGDKKVTVVADAQGLYSFPNLADGAWTIQIQMTGFAASKQDVTIAPNMAAGAFELKLMTLDEIRAAAKPVKVDVTAPVVAANTTAPAPSAPAATAGGSNAQPAAGDKNAAKGKTAAGGNAAAGAAGAGGAQQASAAPPEAPLAPPDPMTAQANDGLLINGSVNNAATSQYALSQAFGNNRNTRSLYNGNLGLQLQSSSLDAQQYSLTGSPTVNPPYTNFTVNVNVGGPLKIPRLLPLSRAPYVYLNYQRTDQDSPSAQPTIVPTAAQLSGDFSQPLINGSVTPTIYVPAYGLSSACLGAPGITPGQPFPGNKIPAACLNPTAQALLGFYPAPNATSSVGNFQFVAPHDVRQDGGQVRVQKQLGSKNNLNGSFGMQSIRAGNTSLFNFHDATDTLQLSANLSGYHRFTQRLSMNLAYNFSRQRQTSMPFFVNRENVECAGQTTCSGLINGYAAQPISGVDGDPNYWGPPGIGFSSSGIAGLSDGIYSNNRGETNSVSGSINWNKFRHNVQIGGDFRRQENNVLSQSNPRGSFSFTGVATGQPSSNGTTTPGTGFDMADMLLGVPDTFGFKFGNADKYYRQSVYDLYANDDFRVNPELSVNAGVRWEYGAPVTELKNRMVNLNFGPDFTTETPVTATNPGSLPTSLVRPDKIGIAPNVGIAWRPISGSSLLIRSGYQISHDTNVYSSIASSMATQTGATPITNSVSISNGASCTFTLNNPFPSTSCPTTTSAHPPIAQQFAVDPNFRVGYVQVWNLSAQRDLPASMQMLVTYRGTKGTRGVQQILPNTYAYGGTDPCPSCPLGYAYRMSNGSSTREEGILTLRRRLRSGFTANLTYTYSKSIDDDYQLGGGGGTGVSAQVAQDWQHPERQRGLSGFDQRHALSFSAQYTTGMGLGGHTLLSGWRGALYKEWTFQTIINAATGTPETPSYPYPLASYNGILRPDYTGGPITGGTRPGQFLNPNAFMAPPLGQFGNARRNSIPGPDQFSMNATMQRTFRLHDRYTLDATIAANNVLNHVTYSGWVTTIASQNYGTVASPNVMRTASVNLRLRF